MKQYTAVQIGLGSRGIIHIDGMNNNPEMFKVIGYCNRSEANLLAAKEKYQLDDSQLYTDAETKQKYPAILCKEIYSSMKIEQ